ncbi:MAG TPA: hypothetical protein VHL78_11880 [Actinomycetota bacterium]|nr:hypothetical protein [Actinomycetota bacterium]
MIRPHRRTGRWSLILIGALWVATSAVWGSALLVEGATSVGVRPAAVAAARQDGPLEADPAARRPQPGDRLPVFARGGPVELRGLSPDVVAVAFHEASFGDAVDLRPVGRCAVCRNRWKFNPPRGARGGPAYIVMDTRGRASGATSAVDAVLPRGRTALAPVTGTVTEVRRYRLYGRHWDVRVEIRPAAAPRRRVVMLHLEGVTLVPGERVEASVTRIGTARRFAFESQVDRYVDGDVPHVHMEVKRAATGRQRQRSKG